MIFIDLEKAYDNVRRDKVWEALINMQVPESLMRRIMKGYEGSKCCLRTPVGQTDWFLPGKEVQQGSVLSPIACRKV